MRRNTPDARFIWTEILHRAKQVLGKNADWTGDKYGRSCKEIAARIVRATSEMNQTGSARFVIYPFNRKTPDWGEISSSVSCM